jgi:hypothetical protein
VIVRLVIFIAITCGFVLAAEQRPSNENDSRAFLGSVKPAPNALPAPISSAIERRVTGDWVKESSVKLPGLAPPERCYSAGRTVLNSTHRTQNSRGHAILHSGITPSK